MNLNDVPDVTNYAQNPRIPSLLCFLKISVVDPLTNRSNSGCKNKYRIFSIFFSYNLSSAYYLLSLKFSFLLKFCVKILFSKHYFSPLNIIMRKRKDPDPDPYLWLKDLDLGGPKTCSGSPKLLKIFKKQNYRGPICPCCWWGVAWARRLC